MSTFQSGVMVNPRPWAVSSTSLIMPLVICTSSQALHTADATCRGFASVSLDVGARPAQAALKRGPRFAFPVGEVLSDLTQIVAEPLQGVGATVGHLENLEHRGGVPSAYVVGSQLAHLPPCGNAAGSTFVHPAAIALPSPTAKPSCTALGNYSGRWLSQKSTVRLAASG